jgi:hypothetical protein
MPPFPFLGFDSDQAQCAESRGPVLRELTNNAKVPCKKNVGSAGVKKAAPQAA